MGFPIGFRHAKHRPFWKSQLPLPTPFSGKRNVMPLPFLSLCKIGHI